MRKRRRRKKGAGREEKTRRRRRSAASPGGVAALGPLQDIIISRIISRHYTRAVGLARFYLVLICS